MPETALPPIIERRDERTHLFVIATIYFGGESIPVRVRNLSSWGAHIEGTRLAPAGSKIILRRGNLQVRGTAVWTEAGKSGVSFDTPVTVSVWHPKKEPNGQQQIDRLVFGARQGGQVTTNLVDEVSIHEEKTPLFLVLEGLKSLKLELSELADKLALDVILVATHPEVQFLDEADQRLRKMLNIIETRFGPF